MKYLRGIGFYVLVFAIILLLVSLLSGTAEPKDMTYSTFVEDLNRGNVSSITIEGQTATILLKDNTTDTFILYIPVIGGDSFFQTINEPLSKGEFELITKPEPTTPWWVSLLPTVAIIAIFVLFWFFFIQQAQGAGGAGKAAQFGKSRARMSTDKDKVVTFADVAGANEEKEELREIVDFLKKPQKYVEIGARIPKGVLLIGPPGTGKTLLAKAVSGEAGVPFFSISGSDFVEMFVGVGASRVRDLFEQAKKHSPSIIFIDEIDAVGRHRGAGLGGGHDEREQTLNQLLVEMDGFGSNEGVILIAATNRPDILDPALLRPGRFDRQVAIGMPDIKGREEILAVHARKKPFEDDVSLAEIARQTPGFTGADLENLLNESAIFAARQGNKKISMIDIKEAIFKVLMGPEKKSRIMSDEERRLTSVHEAGHAIAIKVLSTTDKVHRISIIPAGMAGGYTAHRPEKDVSYKTKSQLLEIIAISLGGRAAEELVIGEISTGAGSDLQTVNNVAKSMVTKYGMSDSLENLIFGDNGEVFLGKDYGHVKDYSEKTAAAIDEEVKNIVDSSYKKVRDILVQYRTILEKLAQRLLEKEKIEKDEFEEIFASY
jgi:cell division protease FtsH